MDVILKRAEIDMGGEIQVGTTFHPNQIDRGLSRHGITSTTLQCSHLPILAAKDTELDHYTIRLEPR